MTAPAAPTRMTWLDANRVMAALGVILIHSTSDLSGQPFGGYPLEDRILPGLLRTVANISSSETFILFSLFLLAFKIERREPTYRRVISDQALRLLVPLVVWSTFYAFFRLIKANALGYEDAIWAELAQQQSWAGYFLLGTAQYHLHFLPTMFGVALFFPAMRAAARYPVLGLAFLPLIFLYDGTQNWLWGHVTEPTLRAYLLAAAKILSYVGFGFAGFALYGLWRGRQVAEAARSVWLFALVCFVALLATEGTYVADSVIAGSWQPRYGAQFYSQLLMPIAVFALFLSAEGRNWSPRWSRAAHLSYGLYLIHPAWIDLVQLGFLRAGIEMPPALQVVTTYGLVVPLTFLTAYGLSRVRSLAWTIGLAPVPVLSAWFERHQRPAGAIR